MTIVVATREFIAADSRLTLEGGEQLTIGKIFKRKGGGVFATAGDCRRTSHFEKAMRQGLEPEPLDELDAEDSDAVLLMPNGVLVYFDTTFGAFPVAEMWVPIGGPVKVARSWLMHGADPVTAIKRCIEVDATCGYPIQIAYPDGRFQLIDEAGRLIESVLARKGRR